jgi:hypothetical protein
MTAQYSIPASLLCRLSKPVLLGCGAIALLSSAPPQEPAGRGVLCLGTFIFVVEKVGVECRVGQDREFQARVANYARRFDDYIIRNTGGDPAVLAKFKDGQNLNSKDRDYICGGDAAEAYDHFKAGKSQELQKAVDKLLARDGPPSFGDCV